MVFYWGKDSMKEFSQLFRTSSLAPHLGLRNYRACSQWVYSGGLPFTGRVAVIGAQDNLLDLGDKVSGEYVTDRCVKHYSCFSLIPLDDDFYY